MLESTQPESLKPATGRPYFPAFSLSGTVAAFTCDCLRFVCVFTRRREFNLCVSASSRTMLAFENNVSCSSSACFTPPFCRRSHCVSSGDVVAATPGVATVALSGVVTAAPSGSVTAASTGIVTAASSGVVADVSPGVVPTGTSGVVNARVNTRVAHVLLLRFVAVHMDVNALAS